MLSLIIILFVIMSAFSDHSSMGGRKVRTQHETSKVWTMPLTDKLNLVAVIQIRKQRSFIVGLPSKMGLLTKDQSTLRAPHVHTHRFRFPFFKYRRCVVGSGANIICNDHRAITHVTSIHKSLWILFQELGSCEGLAHRLPSTTKMYWSLRTSIRTKGDSAHSIAYKNPPCNSPNTYSWAGLCYILVERVVLHNLPFIHHNHIVWSYDSLTKHYLMVFLPLQMRLYSVVILCVWALQIVAVPIETTRDEQNSKAPKTIQLRNREEVAKTHRASRNVALGTASGNVTLYGLLFLS